MDLEIASASSTHLLFEGGGDSETDFKKMDTPPVEETSTSVAEKSAILPPVIESVGVTPVSELGANEVLEPVTVEQEGCVPISRQPDVASANYPIDVPSSAAIVTPITQANAAAPAPVTTSNPTVGTGLQIVTRKRSSMTAAANANSAPLNTNPSAAVEPLSTSSAPPSVANTIEPAKKKKKYIPKTKKPADNPDATIGTNPKPEGGNGTPTPTAAPKPKAPPRPKKEVKATTTSTSRNTKAKKGKEQQTPVPEPPALIGPGTKMNSHNLDPSHPQPQPTKLQMPKLTKMPPNRFSSAIPAAEPAVKPSPQVVIKEEPQEWDEAELNPETMDEDPPVVETEKPGTGAVVAASTSSKRKKSKGRNGNIYIGVVNRIEWMKLQDQFGFKSVNNFGSFVLETMRRVHGDIQFWCDLAEASGVYPDLAKYEWNDGFPHAVNKDGQYFIPEVDSELSDEKREELVDLCRTMWEKRLQQLKQQQLQNESGGSNIPVVPLEDAEEGEEDEAVDEMAGLENYLDNLANGQYSTDVDMGGIVGQAAGGAEGGGQSSVAGMLTHAEVNDIWNAQLGLAESVQNYGNLFNFINSIQGGDGSDQQQQCDNVAVMGLGAE